MGMHPNYSGLLTQPVPMRGGGSSFAARFWPIFFIKMVSPMSTNVTQVAGALFCTQHLEGTPQLGEQPFVPRVLWSGMVWKWGAPMISWRSITILPTNIAILEYTNIQFSDIPIYDLLGWKCNTFSAFQMRKMVRVIHGRWQVLIRQLLESAADPNDKTRKSAAQHQDFQGPSETSDRRRFGMANPRDRIVI